MKKTHSMRISVPTPCTEDWNGMTPNEQGRHCASCNKTIVDFSLFTDKQLIDFFSRATGTICGSFNSMQLQRQIAYAEPRNGFLYKLLFGTAISLGMAGSANANYNPNSRPLVEQKLQLDESKGALQQKSGDDTYPIKGKVCDDDNLKRLQFAEITLWCDGKKLEDVFTDTSGTFKFKNTNNYSFSRLSITVTYADYESKTINCGDVNMGALVIYIRSKVRNQFTYGGHTTGIVDFSRPDTTAWIETKVYDSKTKKMVPNAIIKLLLNGKVIDSVKTNGIANYGSVYSLRYVGSKFVLQVECAGYKTFRIEVVGEKKENVRMPYVEAALIPLK